MSTIYVLAKVLHIMGFIAAVGITLATYFSHKQFWKLYESDREKGIAAFRSYAALLRVGMIGLMLVILAGFTMLYLGNWAFLSLIWFRLKLGLIILIFVNGATLGRTSTLRLQAFVTGQSGPSNTSIEKQSLQTRLKTFQLLQLTIFAAIIIVSAFRFE